MEQAAVAQYRLQAYRVLLEISQFLRLRRNQITAMELFTPDNPWVENDNRRNRTYNAVTAGSLNAKCTACLPKRLIEGKTVLDLGSCIGHAGWWSLSNGARFYCGVETQKDYADTANRLFAGRFN